MAEDKQIADFAERVAGLEAIVKRYRAEASASTIALGVVVEALDGPNPQFRSRVTERLQGLSEQWRFSGDHDLANALDRLLR